MKFLLNISTLHQADGGPSRGTLSVAHELASIGHEVTILCFRNPREPVPSEFDLARSSGVTIIEVRKRRLGKFRFSPRLMWTALRNSSGSDVVTAHGFYQFNSVVAYVISRLRRSAFYIQPHGVFEPYQQQKGSWFKPLYMRVIGNRILNAADYILVASAQERQGVTASTGIEDERIAVTGLGVSHDFTRTPPPDYEARRVLFLSRLAEKKRLDLLIEACRISRSKNAEFHVDVCGTGRPEFVNDLLAKSEGLPVLFHGMVAGEVRDRIVTGSSLFCLPSDNENFGQAVSEAMASGLPVITTASTGASEHVLSASAGWVLEAPDANSVATAIDSALADPQLLEEMGTNGRRYAKQNLTWEAVARKWIGLASRPQSS